ncbi:MAG: nucleotidyl transferase AbiEii/AbiGii toxin family protein [Planctomycetota bacterium]
MAEASRKTPLAEAFVRAVDALDAAGVSYALIGGLAVACHGLPRPTRDIDVLVSLPRIRLPVLLEYFQKRGFSLDTTDVLHRLSVDHLATIRYEGVRLDLLDAVIPFFRRAVAEAVERDIEARRVRVVTPEALVALKLLASRDDDLRDVRTILAVQGDKLDLDLVKRHLAECGAEERTPLLEQLLRKT